MCLDLQEEDQLGYTARLTEVDMEAKESILRQKVVDLCLEKVNVYRTCGFKKKTVCVLAVVVINCWLCK